MIASKDQSKGDAGTSTNLLLADIGNTRVGLATWSKGQRSPGQHLPAKPFDAVVDELRRQWDSLPSSAPRSAVVGSVCPAALQQVREACRAHRIEPVLVVGQQLDLPMPVDLPEPDQVGTDRLCAAAAAFEKMRCACVVADFGTALTIDLVADNGVFLGGTILPGMAMSAQALHEHTAQLPLIEVGETAETLGKDTTSAIRNGIFAMMVGALREVTERYATQIGKWPPLVITGGDAPAIGRACEFVDRVIPDLCLDGLVITYQRSLGQEDDD